MVHGRYGYRWAGDMEARQKKDKYRLLCCLFFVSARSRAQHDTIGSTRPSGPTSTTPSAAPLRLRQVSTCDSLPTCRVAGVFQSGSWQSTGALGRTMGPDRANKDSRHPWWFQKQASRCLGCPCSNELKPGEAVVVSFCAETYDDDHERSKYCGTWVLSRYKVKRALDMFHLPVSCNFSANCSFRRPVSAKWKFGH